MIHSRSFHFLTWLCVYWTLVVKGVITDQDDVDLDSVEMTISSSDGASNGSERERDTCVCSTAGCNYTASNILKDMDPTVNPCDNFYKFTCGGFLNSTTVPDKETKWIPQFSDDLLMEQLRTVIEKESPPNETRPFRLAKDYYKACMDETANEKRGLQRLLNIIHDLGGWPVLEGYHKNYFNWVDTVRKFRELGYSIDYFIGFKIETGAIRGRRVINQKNNSRNYIMLTRPTFVIPIHFLKANTSEVSEYHRDMVEIAVLFGADRQRASTEMEDIIKFEMRLAHIASSQIQSNSLYAMTVNELCTDFPNTPWREYLNSILAPISILTMNETVIIPSRDFLFDFEQLMNTTSKRTLENYAYWRMVLDTSEFIDVIQRQNLTLARRYPENRPKWEKCVKLVANNFDFSVTAMYFNEDAKISISGMFSNIQNAIKRMFEKAKWMDNTTRVKALEKVDSITKYIVYPDEILNVRRLDKFYEKLELSADDPLGNMLNMSIFQTNRLVETLNTPTNWNEWWRTNLRPLSTTGYYELQQNAIQIPSAIMQQHAFFNSSRPYYMNYGAIGALIAHEIIHGFDDKGIFRDKDGHFADWFEPETKQKFFDRIQCLVQQYGNYTEENVEVPMNLNGEQTLTENIADNAGVKAAYFAYRSWLSNSREESLHGLPYTSRQMFWISYGNLHCRQYHPYCLQLMLSYNQYVPTEYRVNVVLSNMKLFSRDFGCKIGSKMNPANKCVVW